MEVISTSGPVRLARARRKTLPGPTTLAGFVVRDDQFRPQPAPFLNSGVPANSVPSMYTVVKQVVRSFTVLTALITGEIFVWCCVRRPRSHSDARSRQGISTNRPL